VHVTAESLQHDINIYAQAIYITCSVYNWNEGH